MQHNSAAPGRAFDAQDVRMSGPRRRPPGMAGGRATHGAVAGMRGSARPFAYLSLHEQRRVTRRRAASGILAFQAIAAGDSTIPSPWPSPGGRG
ncbi:MAG: hypothetical protein MZU91_01200 [Desulfosudis oleivorans]|nr:hypothetical protein [Desulfosudis oleivorans]